MIFFSRLQVRHTHIKTNYQIVWNPNPTYERIKEIKPHLGVEAVFAMN
jgi:hypothetical protein